MINEIIIQLPKGTRKTWFLHIWEHSIVSSLELRFKQAGLDDDGILISAKTFIDSTTIEIYLLNTIVIESVWVIINKTLNDMPLELIEEEYIRLKDEVQSTSTSAETIFEYEGFKKSENADILELYEYEDISNVELNRQFKSVVKDLRFAINLNTTFKILQTNTLNKKDNFSSVFLTRNEKFINFDFTKSIDTIEEYFQLYLLCFIIGMTSESYLQTTYLKKYGKYLGYAQIILYGNDAPMSINGTSFSKHSF